MRWTLALPWTKYCIFFHSTIYLLRVSLLSKEGGVGGYNISSRFCYSYSPSLRVQVWSKWQSYVIFYFNSFFQIGSYFGSTLCVVDLNNDKWVLLFDMSYIYNCSQKTLTITYKTVQDVTRALARSRNMHELCSLPTSKKREISSCSSVFELTVRVLWLKKLRHTV